MAEPDGRPGTAYDRLTEALSSDPLLDTELNRAEILELAAECRIKDLNLIILDLTRRAARLRRQGYDLQAIATALADEVRRRAELLEKTTALPASV